MENLPIGCKRYFELTPVGATNILGYTAKYEIASSLMVVQSGIVEKSPDNTKFLVKVDTSNLPSKEYELRIIVTDESDNFTGCIYTERIQLRN